MASLYDRVSKGTMAISEITDSMRYATSEGGKFYQSMEKQSKTLNGQLSTLKDNASALLGSLTEGLTDDLAVNLLPLANNIVGELQSAFEQGGMDGLIATATDMIPDLLGMMTGKLQDAISGLSRWLPQGVSAIMSTLPNAIKSTSAVLPQITTALFDTASMVVNDLISMLPELIPALMEGIENMAVSLAKGVLQIFTGVFDGIGNAIKHMNQEFIRDGVDTDALKNLDFKMDVDVDTSAATSEIAKAYETIREALQTDLLTDEQKDEIMNMLGEDADAIKSKLMEFGLSEPEAQSIADTISSGGATIAEALNGLNLGVDAGTIAKWFIQANGSNVALRHFAEMAGLDDDDVDAIIGVYNEANGRLADETPSVAETIYDALTDGLADDEETVSGLKAKVEAWATDRMDDIEKAYNAAVAKLDPTAPDYEAKVAELTEQYNQAKKDVQTIKNDSLEVVDALAGQSTKAVQAAYQDIADLETAMSGLEERVAAMKGEALSAAENAYKVVTAGGKADDATISMAVSLKFNEFKVDEQAAQDEYDKTIAELNEQFANRDITKDQFDAGVLEAEKTRSDAVNAAKEAYEQAWASILRGIAESEGNSAAFGDDAIIKARAADIVKQMLDAISEGGLEAVTPEQKQAVSNMLTDIFGGEAYSVDMMDFRGLGLVLSEAYANLLDDVDTSVISGKTQEVWANALDEGILAGTDFDVTEKSDAVAALMSNVYSGASTEVNEAAKSLIEEATDNMDDAAGASTSGDNTVDGLMTSLEGGVIKAYNVGRRTARAYRSGYENTMEIQSPSKVMKRLGRYTGEGLEIGLNESMARAVRVANTMLGGLTTSADLTRMTNVNMPELRQEISIAAEQNKVPVNIDGRKVAEIQRQNNASQLAWLRARDARGYGQR